MPPALYVRTFTKDELERLSEAALFTRRMLEAADYPQSHLDELTLLAIRLHGTDVEVDGIAA